MSPATPVAAIEKAVQLGRAGGAPNSSTRGMCRGTPRKTQCAITAIIWCVRREGYKTQVLGLDASRCKFCGAELNFRTDMKGGLL